MTTVGVPVIKPIVLLIDSPIGSAGEIVNVAPPPVLITFIVDSGTLTIPWYELGDILKIGVSLKSFTVMLKAFSKFKPP
jgi:hypothetical protein